MKQMGQLRLAFALVLALVCSYWAVHSLTGNRGSGLSIAPSPRPGFEFQAKNYPTDADNSDRESDCRWAAYADFPRYDSKPQVPAKLLYVKVPKSGSTTITGLLTRYAVRHNLRPLKPHPSAVFQDDAVIQESLRVSNTRAEDVDALISHILYNETMVRQYLGPRPFRIGSVRDPVDRWMSAYTYGLYLHEEGRDLKFVCSAMSENFDTWVRDCWSLKSHMRYMAPRDWPISKRHNVQMVLNHYDHMFVNEKMTKSILTLGPKIGLGLEEILALSAKTSTKPQAAASWTAEDIAGMKEVLVKKVPESDRLLYDLASEKVDLEFGKLPKAIQNSVEDLETMAGEAWAFCRSSREDWQARGPLGAPIFLNCLGKWLEQNVRCAR